MRYRLLGFLCLITVIAYVQRSALGVPSEIIEVELGLGPAGMGIIMSAWYWAYAIGQLPAGWLADKIGSKPSLVLFALAWSLVTGVVGLATGFVGLLILWTIMGGAQAGVFPCATRAIGATFPRTEQAFASGCLACCMAGGAALAQYVTGQLLGALTWQQILAIYALPGLLWAVLYSIVVPKPDAPRPPRSSTAAPVPWMRLFDNPHMLLLCGQQFLRAAATALFFTWFPRFLQEAKGVGLAESGLLAALPLLAGMLGSLFGGTVSDLLLRSTGNARLSRQGLSTVAMVVSAGASFAAYWMPDAYLAVGLVSVAAFSGYVGGVSAYATAISMGGSRVATVFATMNMSGNVGAAILPLAVGTIAARTGDWNFTLLLFAGLYLGSGICWALLNPKEPVFEEAT
jgi:sugar phosphate permease